ncbi:palmitoyltransferase for Vac8p [Basidiobolus ranarum]|uniref:Palmitoyltransferase n=1 Tax=Basidiobolus ranarum TaxID=34480 RepID=A0ABR2W0Q5_9FUNG
MKNNSIYGYLPIAFIIALFGWSYYTYVFSLVAELISYNFQQAITQLSIFSILFALAFVCYIRALITHAGSPVQFQFIHEKGYASRRELLAVGSLESLPSMHSEPTWCDSYHHPSIPKQSVPRPNMAMVSPNIGQYDTLKSTKWVMEGNGLDQTQVSYCKHCGTHKPQRCHHCSSCDQCILKMDHHCPWINRCVGWRNYKIFYLLILYTSLYCIYIPASVLYPLVTRYNGQGIHIEWLILVVLAALAGVFLTVLTVFHTKLIMRNQTTIENIRQRQKNIEPRVNVYNLGRMENWKAIMGSNWWLWLVPTTNSSDDGYEFPQLIDTEAYVKTMQERRFSFHSMTPSFSTTKSDTMLESPDDTRSTRSTIVAPSPSHQEISITLPPIPKFMPLDV